MTLIQLSTLINAPIERCFDLSRSIDMHLLSTEQTKEKAVAGTTTGLINKGETVTWEAIHFGIRQRLTTKIIEMNRPFFFIDAMQKGAFKSMQHEHLFENLGEEGTLMRDTFYYETPLGIAGRIFDVLVLKKYMSLLLEKRNCVIRQIAESDEWITLLREKKSS